ncbi:uncharacterized protein [Aquarana catesbeiana]|uniref:uncharacterized protein n=1 Tax=Aquarana catesbeiana TaxID=8400 RepID=UPI003CC9D780
MRIGLKILHIIFFLLLLGSGDFQVRGLTVSGKYGTTEALRGEDVTIPCLLSGVPIPLNLREVSVTWTLILQNGTENDVYRFRNSHHESLRSRFHMDDKDLLQGNARLSITNIQITDEGEYRCYVIVTRDHGSITSTLLVSAKPQTSIKHTRLIEDGYEGSVFCNVSNFYPEEVKIRWVKHSKRIITSSSLDEDFSLKPIRNSDGTFNVTSVLTVKPDSRDEPGDVFFCIVSHRSLKEEISPYFTVPWPRRSPLIDISIALCLLMILVSVTFILDKCVKKEWRLWTSRILNALFISTILLIFVFLIYFKVEFGDLPMWLYIVLSCLSIFFLILLAAYGRFLWEYFTTGDLTVSEISGDYSITHMKRTTLTWKITNFRQKEIQINVYLKRRNDIKKHLIASWESNNSSDYLLTTGDQRDNSHNLPLLKKVDASRTLLPVEMEAEIRKSWTGMYECLCSITITLSADTDNQGMLDVEVEHASLKFPESVRKNLNVHSEVVNVIVSDIIGETWSPHMKKTTLSCEITEFRPQDIHINLYLKRRNDTKKHLIHSWSSMDRPSDGNNTMLPVEMEDAVNDTMLPVEMEDAVNDTMLPVEMEDAVNDTMLPVEMEVKMTKTENGGYKGECRISLTPNIDTDDGAILILEVTHAVMRWPRYKYRALNVIKGDKPSLWRRWNKHVVNEPKMF